MSVLFYHIRCCFKNKMTRKALRTVTLFVFMCCTYSVYKLPSLYWSLKSSQHQSVIVKENSVMKDRLEVDHRQVNDISKSQNNDIRIENNFEHNLNVSTANSINTVNGSRATNEGNKTDNGTNIEYDKLLKEIDNGIEADIKYNTLEEDITIGEFVFENEDIEFNINDIDNFRKKSEKLFETFPNHQNSTKYLIYFCEGKCGGLADRLKGITMVYMMSLLTQRRFAISMDTPCEIEHFLQPNLLDWSFPDRESLAGKTVQIIDCFERHDAYEIDLQRYDPDPISMLKAEVVLMKANQDWTRIFRKLSVSPKRFPQLYQYHSSELLRTIYIGLFKPSSELSHSVNEFFKQKVGDKKLACLHARMGEALYQRYTYREIMIPLQFLKRFDNRDDFKIMIATDTENVKTIANHMYKNFVDTSGPILHIDYMRNGSMAQDLKCAGFMRSVVDHVVLQRCDKLVLTGSGFGVTAASIRHTSRGLYVYMRGEAVMPTRRELVRETFQWRCLSPSFDSKFYSNICDS
ncbi:uncharacterized protein LOC132742756 [Ruditapes philippinarum]|uniref:uncharacterized protein LOC132742756 n=1 Tax=Ruditapes philippinarum TaxID=129788 RepID=UPI00295A72B6|nr:uncharacterized protein LOC132742756 [Ruditapes philippinarum]